MNMQPVFPKLPRFYAKCKECKKTFSCGDLFADLDDKAGTFYCTHCSVMAIILDGKKK